MLHILYAIQGTGNGHVARAREIVPLLHQWAQVDVVLSGDQSEVELPFPITYRSRGLTFIYNRQGGISYRRTLLKNNLWCIARELFRFPIRQYDLVINDFEFISAWAARLRGVPCVALGHQASFAYSQVPRPMQRSFLGELILRSYAPAKHHVGFHFHPFARGVFTPVIREDIRQAQASNMGHYTVYLPAYGDQELQMLLERISNVEWQVFSKFTTQRYQRRNVRFHPISNRAFVHSFLHCEGLLTSAGFEAPAEALFLGKKLFVIPIKGQYEQHCNAAALQQMGVPQAQSLHHRSLQLLEDWVYQQKPLQVDFPDDTAAILQKEIFEAEWLQQALQRRSPEEFSANSIFTRSNTNAHDRTDSGHSKSS